MFNIITTLAVGLDDALEKTGRIVRTVGPVLKLGDTHHLISHGTITPPMPLHSGYESVRSVPSREQIRRATYWKLNGVYLRKRCFFTTV